MSFGWSCYDKKGKDIFKEFDPENCFYKCFGFGPSNMEYDTDAPNYVSMIRERICSLLSRSGVAYEEDAKYIIAEVKHMIEENKKSISSCHCKTCSCKPVAPKGWSIDYIDRFLSIPIDRVHKITGGY